MIRRISRTRSWFFEKMNKMSKALARLTKGGKSYAKRSQRSLEMLPVSSRYVWLKGNVTKAKQLERIDIANKWNKRVHSVTPDQGSPEFFC